MPKVFFSIMIASLIVTIAQADVKVVRSMQMDGMMGLGGSTKQMTQWTAADRQREETKGKHPTITRLDKKVRWTLNAPKKSYEEMSLVAPKQKEDSSDSSSKSDDQKSEGREEKPTTRISKAEFSVTPLKQKKKIGAFDCEGYAVRTVIETENLETKERSEIKMITTLWNTQEVGPVAQLKNAEEAYAKAYLTAVGVDASAQASLKMLGTAMFASMAGAGENELSKALKGMPAEMKKVKGYPISTRVEWYGGNQAGAEAKEPEQEDVEIPTDVSSALGGFAASFAKKKMEAKKPAPSPEGQLMMAMTTTIQSIETTKIPSNVFEVPAGFKKTK